ncbi:MAG: membrane protein insertase YidC [Anaerotruncus sp.]|nr:membrane protein insertase YidC [Anaerotruncus sp.]
MLNTIFGYPLGWVMYICYKVIPIYGLALILFTILTRVLLLPLSIKQQKSMVKMKIFQPRMMEIQKKYANNREKMAEEMNRLYAEEGYNPMMGCLPMMIQLPILFGLLDVIYRPMTHILHIGGDVINRAFEIAEPVLRAAAADPTKMVELTKDYAAQLKVIGVIQQNPELFSGLEGLANSVGTLNLNFLGIDLTQTPSLGSFNILWVIPILSFITSLLLSLFTMKQTQSAGDEAAAAAGMTKGMMLMMPLMSGYFAFILPAGVGIYWVISNVLMALQTYLLNKFMNPTEMAEKAKAEYEARREQQRKEKIEAKRLARERGEPSDLDKARSQKEINRLKLAAARKRDAERYGDIYKEVTDDDLK